MNKPSPAVRDLARRLFATEVALGKPPGAPADTAVLICQKLCVSLTMFASLQGFRSLMSRALSLAKAEVPSLGVVRVAEDGSLRGFDKVGQEERTASAGREGLILVSHLLELIVIFIGEALTLSLLRVTWPNVDRKSPKAEEQL